MNKPEKLKGAIFDVDDTLLDATPGGVGLHEQSRLEAAHIVGKRRGIPKLQALTMEQSAEAWMTAREHTMPAATWRTLFMLGLVTTEETEHDHPLLEELASTKDEIHEAILRARGREVPGAAAFVKSLAACGLSEELAIASTSCRRDIDVFLEMSGLTSCFAPEKIICFERITHPKPHPQAFDMAFQSLGLPESARPHVAAFEDHPCGIMSAKAAGLFTCALTTARFTRQDLASLEVAPDLIADSFAELEQLLGLAAHETA